MTAHARPGPRIVIDELNRVISAGEFVGRVVEIGKRRWVHTRPGVKASTSTYRTAEDAARALVDAILAAEASS